MISIFTLNTRNTRYNRDGTNTHRLQILTEEDDTDTSNIMSRLERHNKVKGDIEKVAANVREIIVSVKIYRNNSKPLWRQVAYLTALFISTPLEDSPTSI